MPTEVENHKKIRSVSEIQTWLISYIAEIMEVTDNEIDIKVPFDEYGLDSSMEVSMIADLETWLGSTLDPTIIYDYPTLEKLARHISQVENFAKSHNGDSK